MLEALELINIRSYKNGLFEFDQGVNIVVGPNASGKTNLLESIHMACTGSAFNSADGNMINRESDWGRINAQFDGHRRSVKLKDSPKSKVFVLDDVEKKRLAGGALIPVVLFEPTHMLLLGGEPERRRSYIDGILMQTEPGFRRVYDSYKRSLAQRNRLLKQDSVSSDHLFVWDIRLSEWAGQLVDYRLRYLRLVNDSLSEKYRSVSGNQEILQIDYDSKLPTESYAQAFMTKLKSSFELDRLRGFTGSGPHRDDISVLLDGSEARLNASRGEVRSIVLALKIAELELVSKASGRIPLLLLDDVFSELDGRRRRMMAQSLVGHQTFITTTDADAIVKSYIGDYKVIATG